MKHITRMIMVLIIIPALLVSTISGCGSTSSVSETETEMFSSNVIEESLTTSNDSDNDKLAEEQVIEDNQIINEMEGLSSTQLNSNNMLNYITVLSSEINESRSSRVFIEEAYSSLVNNIYPNSVDEMTQVQIENLLNTLDSYRMLNVKRDRIEYLYDQNKARAIKIAIPNPVGLLSAIESRSKIQAIAAVIYMAIDSYTSYSSAKEQSEFEYLQSGWELEDEESEELFSAREAAFSYMISMVRRNNLPGEWALNEDAVDQFVQYKNNSNLDRRIEFLESNQNTYVAYGEYWLVLAKSYYDKGEYKKCLEAVSDYEQMTSKIFRRDYEYAHVLPFAIIAAEEVYDSNEYVEVAKKYAEAILSNIDNSDWASRYFVAQIYINLYAKTNNIEYLDAAYNCALDNVNYLVDDQKKANDIYLQDVVETPVAKDATKREKNEVKSYNKMLKEIRKTELPPVNYALYLNCELLFALSNQIGIGEKEKEKINNILHENGAPLFLVTSLESRYSFEGEINSEIAEASFDDGKVVLPAELVSDGSAIRVTVIGSNGNKEINDWDIKKVERNNSDDVKTFLVTYNSPEAKAYEYSDGDIVQVEILTMEEEDSADVKLEFLAKKSKKILVFDDIVFERTK